VGFYLWFDDDLAWAQGTYEYRPMGTAVISSSDLFQQRDFSVRSRRRPPRSADYAGQFASIGHLNQQLKERRKSQRVARASSAAAL
jgi:hypothetical protein